MTLSAKISKERRAKISACLATACAAAILPTVARANGVLSGPIPTSATVHLPKSNVAPSFVRNEDDAAVVLWPGAPLRREQTSTSPATKAQMQQGLRAFIAADPTLNDLYSWRQAMRGGARKSWKLGNSAMGEMQLQLGAQTLPVLQLSGVSGTRAAVGLGGGSFGLYSMRPLRAVNDQLTATDSALGDRISHDETSLDWFVLQPLKTKSSSLQLVTIRGDNDLNPNSTLKTTSELRRGSVMGGTFTQALPSRWKFQSEWLRSNFDDLSLDLPRDAMVVAVSGPVSHPWGEMKLRLAYRDIGAGFQNFAGVPADAGATTRVLSATQPIGSGELTGAVKLDLSQRVDGEDSALGAKTDDGLSVAANVKWKILPDVAISATHTVLGATTDSAETSRFSSLQNSSQAAVEWKVNPAISLILAGTATQRDQELVAQQNADGVLSSHNDNRFSLGLKSRSPIATFGVEVARQSAFDSAIGDNAALTDSLSLSAERKLSSWLKLGGIYRVNQSSDALSPDGVLGSQATARAAFSLQDLGDLELRYMQGNGLNNDGVRLASSTGWNGYGVRYLFGAKSGQAGFGLSLDYSLQNDGGVQPNQTWRLGITYR